MIPRRSFAVFLVLVTCVRLQANPWDEHGRLRVSTNGRFLEHQDGTPFLWLGCTAWGMFMECSREDVDRYLDDRKSKGFSVVQAVAHWWPHGSNSQYQVHNYRHAYGHRPFHGGENTPDMSLPLVVAGGSPVEPSDYWDHADYVVDAVRKRGMCLALFPFWSRAYVNEVSKGFHQECTESEARAYGRFLGKRYKHQPHIVWVTGGDAKKEFRINVYRALAEGIAEGQTGKSIAWNQEDPAWRNLMITYHPGGGASSSRWFHTDPWLSFNMVQSGQRSSATVYPLISHDYSLTGPTKPVINREPCYEGWTGAGGRAHKSALEVRRALYRTFFAGAAGFTYGHGASRADSADHLWALNQGWEGNLTAEGARQLTYARNLLLTYQWWHFVPDSTIILSGKKSGAALKAAVRSPHNILVYFADNSTARILNPCSRKMQADWFDPSNGTRSPAGCFVENQARRLKPPTGWQDAVLILAPFADPDAKKKGTDR